MSCSRSLVRALNSVRLWNAVAAAAALYWGFGWVLTARAADHPAADKPPAAENILDEVVRQNSDRFAAPPAPMKSERVTPFKPHNFTIHDKGPSQIRVTLPSKQPLLTPAVADGKVFVGGGFSSSDFYCLAQDTGRPVWGAHLSDNGPSTPTYNRGTLSFTTESCTVYVLDAATGNCLWAAWLGDPIITAPTIADDRVLVCYPASVGVGRGSKPPATNFVFAARDLRTGKPLWQKWIDENIISAPVVAGDDVYLATFAGTLYGFNLDSGKVELARRCRATSAPVVLNHAIYLSRRVDAGGDSMPMECVARLDCSTGEPVAATAPRQALYLADGQVRARLSSQQKSASEPPKVTSLLPRPAASPFQLVAYEKTPYDPDYVPGGTPPVVDSRPDSIKLVGRSEVSELQRFDGSRLAAMGGSLFNCMGGDLQSIDPRTGKVRWSLNLPRPEANGSDMAALPPVAVAGRLYVATRAGELLRVSPADGSIDGQVKLGAAASTQPVFDDGHIVVGTVSGELVMLKSKDRKLTGWNQWGGGASHAGVDSNDPAAVDDGLFTPEDEPPPVARTGQKLADATRAALRRFAKVSGKAAGKARQELGQINDELEQDTVMPQQQRDTLRFAVKRRLRQLDAEP
jgi:outer membrane protein assembly factor BamB